MNEAAVKPASYAQARVREPAGERTVGEAFSIGGIGADIVVPGAGEGPQLQVERRQGVWVAEPVEKALVRFDGRPLVAPRDLRSNDVVAIGDAQLIVADVTRTLLRLDVVHLVSNATIAPAATVATLALGEGGDEELEIHARGTPVIPLSGHTGRAALDDGLTPAQRAKRRRTWWIVSSAFALALLFVGVASMLESVPLDVLPGDARVKTSDTFLSLRSADRLILLPGKHVVRAEREGYYATETEIDVGSNNTEGVRFRLAKLPGKLQVDTGGIAAIVIVDGAELGRVPGEVDVPAGDRTITVHAPRYLDYTTRVSIKGATIKQNLSAVLKPAWGSVEVTSIPAGAQVSVDDVDLGATPKTLEVESGVRVVRISAAGLKTWESSVVVKAGERLDIGPVTLGQADAHLTLKSTPAGAEIVIAGAHRGKTPLQIDLPAGVAHDVVIDLPGYASWTRSVFAEPGGKIGLDARLEELAAAVTVQGEPTDAELFIDGAVQGRTPQTVKLSAIEHRVEVRKEGFLPFTGSVTPATGLERQIHYHLVSTDRAVALQEAAPTIATGDGYAMRLVPVGTFLMGSDRREQGRRPNEGLRQVALKRPYYLGVTEITNGQFRKFRASHASGFIDKHTVDLDNQPVTQVNWNDAAEYCNWLSERDGLPPAYEKKDTGYVLKRPVTTGYRLPTEAEWEYAARYASPGKFRRFAWGDALPVQDQVGNIAGQEAAAALPASLQGYKDDYPVVAPVGKFKPSPLGFQDLSGNVSEWINDYYFSFVDPTPVSDPLGPEDGTRHVVRGANWKTAVVTELRLAWRDVEDAAGPTLGFRIARYAE